MTEIKVHAPFDGNVVALETVPDQVFAQKMVGDGVAIDPAGMIAVAPVAGTLVKLFSSGHAFGIETKEGVELIVHIGLDTVELAGQGFEKIATEGQQVQVGTPIVRFDRTVLEKQAKVALSPVVSTGKGTIVKRASGAVHSGQDVLFVIQL